MYGRIFLSTFLGLSFLFSNVLGNTARSSATELSAFEKALMAESSVTTKETIVQYGDRKYRRVEYSGEVFFFRLQSDMSSDADLLLICGDQQAAVFNGNSKPMVTFAARITRRTRLFIEGLRKVCSGDRNHTKMTLIPDIAVGFMFDDDPNPKSVFKNRRILIGPSLVPAFAADF